jgi:hypothetical protein
MKVFIFMMILGIANPTHAAENDFHSASYCTGTPLTGAAARKFFAPGSMEAILPNYQVSAQARNCNQMSGCTAWANTTYSMDGLGWYTSNVPINGSVGLHLIAENLSGLWSSSYSGMLSAGYARDGFSIAIMASGATLLPGSEYTTGYEYLYCSTSDCEQRGNYYVPDPFDSPLPNDPGYTIYPGPLNPGSQYNSMSFHGILTAQCGWYQGNVQTPAANTNPTQWQEVQVFIYGSNNQ